MVDARLRAKPAAPANSACPSWTCCETAKAGTPIKVASNAAETVPE
jgi:hypothetical protein